MYKQGNIDNVKYLIDNYNKCHDNALIIAYDNNHFNIVEYLISKNANINYCIQNL